MAGTRSFWAWGYEDQFPDEAGRELLSQGVSALLGVPALGARPLPQFSEAALPSPRIAVPSRLTDFATTDPRERAMHTYGKGFCDLVRAFALDFRPAPDFVLLPRDEDDIVVALAECSAAGIAVIPFGGGTSVVGGVEAQLGEDADYRGVASLDLRRLDRVLEVAPESLAARIQAGAFGPSLEAQLAPHGLTLRHFPQSFEFSTLGGWLATRAGGHFATLYTHIDDFVESVRVVTPSGILATRRLPASGAGPAPKRWLLGSEGTLGVFTEAWLRVQRKPRWRSSASVNFPTFDASVAAVRAVAQSGLHPSNCRLLDAGEAMLHGVAGVFGQPVLLLGFESADHPVAEPLSRALAICADHEGACPRGAVHRESGERGSDGSGGSWRQAFFAAPYRQSALLSLGIMADTFETACPWDRFSELHGAVRTAVEGVLKERCGGGVLTLRFTHVYPDGPAPYFTFLAPLPAGADAAAVAVCWQAVKTAASDAILASGGTITHHHAVGRTHRPWYQRERAPLFGQALAAVKRTLDPSWVLNPGVLLEREGHGTQGQRR
jgi:alkyldihydroxyacetonephosphate synthase